MHDVVDNIEQLELFPCTGGQFKPSLFPVLSGVYLFLNEKKEVLYVGKALSLRSRIASYFAKTTSEKVAQLRTQARFVTYIPTDSDFTALLVESALIKRYTPMFNVIHKDDKHYLYIKVTTSDEFPTVTTSRREDNHEDTYFGPFPHSSTVKEVLTLVRRALPFCSQKRIGSRACFYTHLGLCNPCPSIIVRQKGELHAQLKRQYKTNIRWIISLLSGNYQKLNDELTNEMERFSQEEKFEDAARTRDIIEKIKYLTSSQHSVASYLDNPNFLLDARRDELTDLREILKRYYPNIDYLKRIECFDISNLFGREAVGSMVVLTDGVEDRGAYRRFKIKTVRGANDPAMMKEVLLRRLKHDEWSKPDLIVVDGGKTQLAAARAALHQNKKNIPVIGLAKAFERIAVLIGSTTKYIRLPLTRPAINILRKIRDEAHRFAITYHRKLRKKF